MWLPVSSQGVLVAIGGVVDPPELAYGMHDSAEQNAGNDVDPNFMTTLPVYDIASQVWFPQEASGDIPGPLTDFCAIGTNTTDPSSFEVYVYGGNNGTPSASPLGEVWVLSVPSFIWVQAYKGSDDDARDAHACIRPYPDQMFVI